MGNRYSNAGPSDATIAATERYEKRVRELEAEGMTTSDAQAVADVEVDSGLPEPVAATDLTRQIELVCFVAVGPGEWARGTTLQVAIDAVRKRLHEPLAVMPKGKERKVLRIWASNAPLDVETSDFGIKVRARPGRLLTTFLI